MIISVKSATSTELSLVSSVNKGFEFKLNDATGDYEPIDLLRFAELQPHLVVANPSINDTQPIDLSIVVRVNKLLHEPIMIQQEDMMEQEGVDG